MSETTRQRLLAYAAERLGKAELAARLKVAVETLDGWIAGRLPVPNRKLLLLADLIDEFDKEP
jgi:hypothetical protein